MCKITDVNRDRRKIKIALYDNHHSSDLSQAIKIYFAYLLLQLIRVVRYEVKVEAIQWVQDWLVKIFINWLHQIQVQVRALLSDAWLAETRSITITDQNTSPITGNSLIINHKLKNLFLSFIFLFFSFLLERSACAFIYFFSKRWPITAGIAGTTRQKGEIES